MYLRRKAAATTAIGDGGGISNAIAAEIYRSPIEGATIDFGVRRGSQPLPACSFDGARNLPPSRIGGAAVSSIVNLPIEEIHRRADARPQKDDVLAGLEESIGLIGLLNPIRVRPIVRRLRGGCRRTQARGLRVARSSRDCVHRRR